jgi:hypothetical protein
MIVPDIGRFFYGTRYRATISGISRYLGWYAPISGISRYRGGYFPISGISRYLVYPDIGKYPISVHKMRPDIGSDIGIYTDIAGGTPDIGIGCPDILPDILPEIMTFPQPVLLFPAADATAAAAAYLMLRNPCC